MEEIEKIKTASEWQGSDRYAGIDTYEVVELKAGTQLCALAAYRPDTGELKPCEYLFPKEELNHIDNDSIALNRGLQIEPWINPQTRICSYRSEVVMFELQQDMRMETGKDVENTAYGQGGKTKDYIPAAKFDGSLRNGDLKRSNFGESANVLLLNNNMISKSEYDDIISKNDQLLLRRNLFCNQKAKLDTLEIIQNSPNPEDVKTAEKNLKKLNNNIFDLKQSLKDSIKENGPVPSPLYDSLNKQLAAEIAYRESHPNNLMLSNVVVKKAERKTTDVVLDRSNMNVVVESGRSRAEEIGENLFRKIEDYKEDRGDRNAINVDAQNLYDVMNINRINSESRELMRSVDLRQRDYSQLQTLAIQGTDGKCQEFRVADHFTEDSVRKLQNCRNGTLSEPLEMKGGTMAKLYVEGNKAQLYLAKDKEFLSKQIDKLGLDDAGKSVLKAGGGVSTKHGYLKADKDLNVLVPARKREDQPKQSQTKRESHVHIRPKPKGHGCSM